jgi:hypothetical protein
VNDHWLSALDGFQERARHVVDLLEEMLARLYEPPLDLQR